MGNYIKIGLIGGKTIKTYTLAPFVWEKIGEIANITILFEVFPISSEKILKKFYQEFLSDLTFVGFNVALPWKTRMLSLVPRDVRVNCFSPCINTVYKKDGKIQIANTDVLGIDYILSKKININGKNILILGEGDAGNATALYLQKMYDCHVFTYDIKKERYEEVGLTRLLYNELSLYVFDIIINATTVGKYFFDNRPNKYELPISISLFSQIIHKSTVVQEMNYYPQYTEFLHLADKMKLVHISGLDMLIAQAVETFYLYTHIRLSTQQIIEIQEYMQTIGISLLKKYGSHY